MDKETGVAWKGDVKDVCAEIEKEAKRCKGMTVHEYLCLRKLERAEAQQFGCTEAEIKKGGKQ